MHPEFDGIKYYSKEDMSVGWELQRAEPILADFDVTRDYDDINEIIELYNIQKLLETEFVLSSWNEIETKHYQGLVGKLPSVIGKYLSKINNSNFSQNYVNTAVLYLGDFWELVERYKVYCRITPTAFLTVLQESEDSLSFVLKHQQLVNYYDEQLAGVLRASNITPSILSKVFLEDGEKQFFLPSSFHPEEFEPILQNYIQSENPNVNILQLIYKAQSNSECPISDNLRLSAKHAIENYWKKHGHDAIKMEYGGAVGFCEQDEPTKTEFIKGKYQLSYDIHWLEHSLDYPSLLNNFRYIFGMIDLCGRSVLPAVKAHNGGLEELFSVKGKRWYKHGTYFKAMEMIASSQMNLYYDFLRKHGVDLEQVFQWVFETYLPEEFGVYGFKMNASTSDSTYLEKIKNLMGEMEGVLKQYRMYVQDGKIDRELFEISSEHLIIGDIPSLIPDKYVYGYSKELEHEMAMLFSAQSVLSYTDKTKSKYNTLYKLLQEEKITLTDFKNYQLSQIQWLISRGVLEINESDEVVMIFPRVLLLKDLYEHDVVCAYMMKSWHAEIELLLTSGDLRIGTTLFSEPERDYLNYVLNKSEYSNGLDLRNKYAHGSYPNDEMVQRHDYIQLLIIMVLLVTKINDEFCYRQDKNCSV